jgi:peptidoglycan-associated lipoprotein
MGPQKKPKEGIVLAGVVLFIGGLHAAIWLYSQSSNQAMTTPLTNKIEHADVSDLLKKATVVNQGMASTTYPTQVTTQVVSAPDIVHTDIYFEVGRKGLTDQGKAQLSAQADMLKLHEEYGVWI